MNVEEERDVEEAPQSVEHGDNGMRRTGACLLLILLAAFTLAADETDVILRARNDATEDGRDYHAFWWGVGGVTVAVVPVVMTAFFGDAISVEARRLIAVAAPPAGGVGLSIIGFSTGKADVPDARISEIQDEYRDPSLVSRYESEYRKTLTKILRHRRGTSALIGFGGAVGVMGAGFLVVYLTK